MGRCLFAAEPYPDELGMGGPIGAELDAGLRTRFRALVLDLLRAQYGGLR
jgi:hypothetical protein